MQKKSFAVKGCEAIDRDSFKVPDIEDGSKEQYEITSINFIKMIYNLAGWNQEKNYRVSGQAYPTNRLVVFYIEDADEIREDKLAEFGQNSDND